MSHLISTLSTKVTDTMSWPGKHSRRHFRIWVPKGENSFNVIGVTASNLMDVKKKSLQFLNNVENLHGNIEAHAILILTKSKGTIITDDDYLAQVSLGEDLLMLLPGQNWEEARLKSDWSNEDEPVECKALIFQDRTPNQPSPKSNFRYFVPTPEGEVARFTVDVFREQPTDAGCVRLTAATAGDAGMTVSYEVRLNGARTVVHYALRWTASLLTFAGKLMVETGELLKGQLK